MFLQTPPALILASTSTYRRALLERLRLPFECRAPQVAEDRLPQESATALVQRLALAKASAVAALHPAAWVIGSDQLAVLGTEPEETILGKPGSAERCIEQLQASAGRTVRFLTAVALVRRDEATSLEFLDITRVRFATLDAALIARYIERERPLDCAGSFKSEGLGIALCESIETADPTALIGLPLIGLAARLRAVGYPVP